MSTFPVREDEYAVEEISYDDMMAELELQKQKNAELSQQEPPVLLEAEDSQEALSKRLSENANRQLPDWLLAN